MTNSIRTHTLEIPTNDSLSMDNVMKCWYLFIKNYRDEPGYIKLHPFLKQELHNLATPYFSESASMDTLLGMKIEYDDRLEENEWRIGKSDSKVEAIR